MHDVKFKSIDDFLDYLPKDELQITLRLMNIVENSILNYKRKLSYNLPFYPKNKSICLIWPASVLWGKKKTYIGVRLGITKGYLIQDELNYSDKGNRKQVYWKDYKSVSEIDEGILKAYLFEAVKIDEKL